MSLEILLTNRVNEFGEIFTPTRGWTTFEVIRNLF